MLLAARFSFTPFIWRSGQKAKCLSQHHTPSWLLQEGNLQGCRELAGKRRPLSATNLPHTKECEGVQACQSNSSDLKQLQIEELVIQLIGRGAQTKLMTCQMPFAICRKDWKMTVAAWRKEESFSLSSTPLTVKTADPLLLCR